MADFDTLSLKVTGDSESATAGIQALEEALSGLSTTLTRVVGELSNLDLSGVTSTLDQLTTALRGASEQMAGLDVAGIANAMQAFGSTVQGSAEQATTGLTAMNEAMAQTRALSEVLGLNPADITPEIDVAEIREGEDAIGDVGEAAEVAGTQASRASGLFGTFMSGVASQIRRRLIRALISEITKSITAGLTQLNKYSSGVRSAFATVKAAMAQMGGQAAGALAEIILNLAGTFQTLANWVTVALEQLSIFFAFIGGRKTYFTVASAGASGFGQSLSGAASSAKALKQELMGFDEINSLSPSGGSGGGGGGGSSSTGGMVSFEEKEIPEWMQGIQNTVDNSPWLQTILDIMKWGAVGIGAWQVIKTILEKLKSLPVVGGILTGILNGLKGLWKKITDGFLNLFGDDGNTKKKVTIDIDDNATETLNNVEEELTGLPDRTLTVGLDASSLYEELEVIEDKYTELRNTIEDNPIRVYVSDDDNILAYLAQVEDLLSMVPDVTIGVRFPSIDELNEQINVIKDAISQIPRDIQLRFSADYPQEDQDRVTKFVDACNDLYWVPDTLSKRIELDMVYNISGPANGSEVFVRATEELNRVNATDIDKSINLGLHYDFDDLESRGKHENNWFSVVHEYYDVMQELDRVGAQDRNVSLNLGMHFDFEPSDPNRMQTYISLFEDVYARASSWKKDISRAMSFSISGNTAEAGRNLDDIIEKLDEIPKNKSVAISTTGSSSAVKDVGKVKSALSELSNKKLSIKIGLDAASKAFLKKLADLVGGTEFEKKVTSTIEASPFAKGGFPQTGQLFLAAEQGPEIIGQVGHRTAVANETQIGDVIFRYMKDAQNSGVGGINEDRLAAAIVSGMKSAGIGATYLDGRQIAASINRLTQTTGKPAIKF